MTYPNIREFFDSFGAIQKCESTIKKMLIILNVTIDGIDLKELTTMYQDQYTYSDFLNILASQILSTTDITTNMMPKNNLLCLEQTLNKKLNKSSSKFIMENVFNKNKISLESQLINSNLFSF